MYIDNQCFVFWWNKFQFSKNEKNSPKTEKLPLIKKEDIYMTIEQIIHLRETEDKVEFALYDKGSF